MAVVVVLQGGPVVPQAGTHVLCGRLFTVLVGPCDPQHRVVRAWPASEISLWKAAVSPLAALWITCAHSLGSLALGEAIS